MEEHIKTGEWKELLESERNCWKDNWRMDLGLPKTSLEEGSHVSSAAREAPKPSLNSYLGAQEELLFAY